MNNIWQLYEINDYKKINAMLNNYFNEVINEAKIQIEAGEKPILSGRNARIKMESFMDSIDGYGASDTEPRTILFERINSELKIDSL